MHKDFGDLGVAIKALVDDYQSKTKSTQNIQSIGLLYVLLISCSLPCHFQILLLTWSFGVLLSRAEDMKRFVEDYPEIRKMSSSVSKHLEITRLLQKLIQDRRLLDLSEVEQTLAAQQDHSAAVKMLQDLLADQNLKKEDVLRLLMMYVLRYEGKATFRQEFEMMARSKFGVTPEELKVRVVVVLRFAETFDGAPWDVRLILNIWSHVLDTNANIVLILVFGRRCPCLTTQLVRTLLEFGGEARRSLDLFENKSILKVMRGTIKRGLYGVTNIYTQHTPLVSRIVRYINTNRLKESLYPFHTGTPPKDKKCVLGYAFARASISPVLSAFQSDSYENWSLFYCVSSQGFSNLRFRHWWYHVRGGQCRP